MSKQYKVSVVVVTRDRSEVLRRCLKSIYKSILKPSKVIVVDNASADNTALVVKKSFPKVHLIRNSKNTGAATGRNIGATGSDSEFIFFLDDDAYIEPSTIQNALKVILTDPNIAIVQTKVLSDINPKKILGIAHDIDTRTSLIKAYGVNELDKGQYSNVIDIPMVGTGWLIRRKVFNRVDGFDEKFFVPYEDSDISLRIRKLGYRIVFAPNSQIWHQELKKTDINPRIRSIGIASPERALYVGRNKIYFMRKHSSGVSRKLFFFILLPVFISYHCFIITTSFRFDILWIYLRGVYQGFKL